MTEIAHLEAWLMRHRPDVLESLQGPATNREISALLVGLQNNGFPEDAELPADLVSLLRWRSGETKNNDAACFFGGRDLMPPDWTVESHRIMMGHKSDAPADEPGFYHPGWIGVLDNNHSTLCIDAIGTLGHQAGQIVFVDFKGDEVSLQT